MNISKLQIQAEANWDILVLASSLAVLTLISFSSLPLPSVVCAQDVGVLLDAGWRHFQGQRCHADYISPLGPLFAFLPGVFFKIFGPQYESLKLLPVTVTAFTAVWTFVLTRGAVPKVIALLGSIAVGLFAGGLFHPGFEYRALTFAVFYNRAAYGLLSIAILAALLPRGGRSAGMKKFLDASLGASLCCLLFLKINFFAAGCLFGFVSLLLFRRSNSEWAALFGSVLISCIFFGAAIGFRFDLMFADLRLALFSREGSTSNLFFYPLRNFQANADYFAIVGLLSVVAVLVAIQEPKQRRSAIVSLGALLSAVAVGFGLTLMQSHGDGRCFPTVVSGAIALLAWMREDGVCRSLTFRILGAGTIGLSLLVIFPHASAYIFLKALRAEQFPGAVSGEALGDWRVSQFNTWGEDFAPLVNEGMVLVKEHAAATASLQYIDMANSFSFGLGMRSPKRSMLWWDDRSTYSAKAHPTTEVFQDTDYLLIPITRPVQPQPVWNQIYGDYVTKHYEEAGKSPNFLLLRRKAGA